MTARDPRFAQLDAAIAREADARRDAMLERAAELARGTYTTERRKRLTPRQRRRLYLLELRRFDDLQAEGLLRGAY